MIFLQELGGLNLYKVHNKKDNLHKFSKFIRSNFLVADGEDRWYTVHIGAMGKRNKGGVI